MNDEVRFPSMPQKRRTNREIMPYMAVNWEHLQVVTIGRCISQTVANKKAAELGLCHAYTIRTWRAAAGDKEALFQAVGDGGELSIFLPHPDTDDAYTPTLNRFGKVGLKKIVTK